MKPSLATSSSSFSSVFVRTLLFWSASLSVASGLMCSVIIEESWEGSRNSARCWEGSPERSRLEESGVGRVCEGAERVS